MTVVFFFFSRNFARDVISSRTHIQVCLCLLIIAQSKWLLAAIIKSERTGLLCIHVFELCKQELKRLMLLNQVDKIILIFYRRFIYPYARVCANSLHIYRKAVILFFLIWNKHILITHTDEKERLKVNKISLFGDVLCNKSRHRLNRSAKSIDDTKNFHLCCVNSTVSRSIHTHTHTNSSTRSLTHTYRYIVTWTKQHS